jgi:hypothetical protein
MRQKSRNPSYSRVSRSTRRSDICFQHLYRAYQADRLNEVAVATTSKPRPFSAGNSVSTFQRAV